MGHGKVTAANDAEITARYERAKDRERKKAVWEEIVQQIQIIVFGLAEMVAVEECMQICAEQIKIGREYVNVDKEKLECDCSRTFKELQNQLADCQKAIDDLTEQGAERLPPFCKESFMSDDFTVTHTVLPKLKVLKAVFDHVSRTLLIERATKLSQFQEFIIMCNGEAADKCTEQTPGL